MKQYLWAIFGWGVLIIGIIFGVTLALAHEQMVTFAHAVATTLTGFLLPIQVFVWVFFVCLAACTVFGTGWVAAFAGNKILEFQDRRYNMGLVHIEEGAAIAHRQHNYLLFRNPRSAHTEVTELAGAQALLPAPQLPTAPPFSTIVNEITETHVPLGYTIQGWIWGVFDDLLSTGVIGLPRYGKSMALRFLVAVALKIGAELLGWDPHSTVAEEFGEVMHIVDEKDAIVESARSVKPMLQQRLQLRKQKVALRPLVIFIDELPTLIAGLGSDEAQLITDAIESVILEGPKVRMYMIIAGQGLPARLFKDSLSRNSLSSKYVFYVEWGQANMSGLDKKEWESMVVPLQPMLRKGISYFKCPSQNIRVHAAIPATTEEDLRRLLSTDAFDAVDDFEGAMEPLQPRSIQPQPVTYKTRVHEFWFTMTDVDATSKLPKRVIVHMYKTWCRAKGLPANEMEFYKVTGEVLEDLQLGNTTVVLEGSQVPAYIGRKSTI